MNKVVLLVAYAVACILKALLPNRLPTYIETETGWMFTGWSWEYPRYKVWAVLSLSILGILQLG